MLESCSRKNKIRPNEMKKTVQDLKTKVIKIKDNEKSS